MLGLRSENDMFVSNFQNDKLQVPFVLQYRALKLLQICNIAHMLRDRGAV